VSIGLGGQCIKIKVKGHCQHNWIYQLEKLTMTEQHKLWSSYAAKSHQYPGQEIYTQPYYQGHKRD
jgi:hypothetical protein